MCYSACMKAYVHARLEPGDRAVLDELKARTGLSESDIIRRGLHLVVQAERQRASALDLAGTSVGRFTRGPRDLSADSRHFEDFGA